MSRGRPFAPGESGNPAGRRKGARNRLAEDFLGDLYREWQTRGRAAIASLDDAALCGLVAKTLPRSLELEAGEGLSDMIRRAAEVLAARGA
jgi:hypothetical protein